MKNLNGQHAWLPAWPNIWETGPNEYLVEGKHVSYRRYQLTCWIFRVAVLIYFYHVFTSRYHWEITKDEFTYSRQPVYDRWHWQIPVMIVVIQFMVYVFITTIFPLQKWINWLFLRQRTRVAFSQNQIAVNGKKFDVPSSPGIQFCANRMPLAERYVNRQDYRKADYLIRFRIIDMIYGARVVPITTIDNEEKAKQFVVALQIAFQGSQSPQVSVAGRSLD